MNDQQQALALLVALTLLVALASSSPAAPPPTLAGVERICWGGGTGRGFSAGDLVVGARGDDGGCCGWGFGNIDGDSVDRSGRLHKISRSASGDDLAALAKRSRRFKLFAAACTPVFTRQGWLDASGLDASGLDASGLDASGLDASGLDASAEASSHPPSVTLPSLAPVFVLSRRF